MQIIFSHLARTYPFQFFFIFVYSYNSRHLIWYVPQVRFWWFDYCGPVEKPRRNAASLYDVPGSKRSEEPALCTLLWIRRCIYIHWFCKGHYFVSDTRKEGRCISRTSVPQRLQKIVETTFLLFTIQPKNSSGSSFYRYLSGLSERREESAWWLWLLLSY